LLLPLPPILSFSAIWIVQNYAKLNLYGSNNLDQTTKKQKVLSWFHPHLSVKHQGYHSERMKFLTTDCGRCDGRKDGKTFCIFHDSADHSKLPQEIRRKDSKPQLGCHFAHVNPKTGKSDKRSELVNEILHLCDHDVWHFNPNVLNSLRKKLLNKKYTKKYESPSKNSFTRLWLDLKNGILPEEQIQICLDEDLSIARCPNGTMYHQRFNHAVAAWTVLRAKFIPYFEANVISKLLQKINDYGSKCKSKSNLNSISDYSQTKTTQTLFVSLFLLQLILT
jgi:hypothetical protein